MLVNMVLPLMQKHHWEQDKRKACVKQLTGRRRKGNRLEASILRFTGIIIRVKRKKRQKIIRDGFFTFWYLSSKSLKGKMGHSGYSFFLEWGGGQRFLVL